MSRSGSFRMFSSCTRASTAKSASVPSSIRRKCILPMSLAIPFPFVQQLGLWKSLMPLQEESSGQ